MLIKKEENQNGNENANNQNNNIENNFNREVIPNNIREVINGNNPRNMRRGFNIFLLHGLSNVELRTMRILFHIASYQQSMQRGTELDWSEEGIYQREERWLINQLNNPIFDNNANINNNDHEQERDNERDRMNRNNTYIRLNINEEDELRRRYIDNLINFEFEPGYLFLIGFCIGFLVNAFGIFLFLCNFKKKFKIGIICGMILSMVFYSMTILSVK